MFKLRPIACCVMLACCGRVAANPVAPTVVNGSAAFATPDARTLHVTNSPGAIINWQGFSIGAGEITRFTQQSAMSAVLNRVVGADISKIQGQLLSNGRVFLINPAGILIGGGAVIDTAGFVGSTLNMSNADFLAGKLKFDGGTGTVRNEGSIRASGDIYLVGPMVENLGAIRSENGNVVLAAGKSVTITSPTLDGVQFTLQAPTDTALNLGTIDAKNAVAMFAGTLKHSGDTHAGGMSVDAGGNIVLVAQKDLTVDPGSHLNASGTTGGNVTVQSGGTTLVSGVIDATGSAGKGGTVHLLGERVGVMGAASVDASGQSGGGTILVGGDYQGKNPSIQNAQATYIGPDAKLEADAITSGDGGKLIVWSDGPTRVYGSLSVRGGAQSGDGGLVETSGHYLDAPRDPNVAAPAGRGGMWLLDPGEVVITQAGPDANVNTAGPIFDPQNENAQSTLSAGRISSFLTSNGSLTITTTRQAGPNPPGLSGDIIFDATAGAIDINKLSQTGGSDSLTLNAAHDIVFRGGQTTFRTPPPVGGVAQTQTLTVAFNPGNQILTEGAATVLLSSADARVTAQVLGGRPWQNNGTINVNPGSAIQLHDGAAAAATLNNSGVINVSETNNPAFFSDAALSGVLNNNGMLNVTASAQFDVQFNNGGTGNLAISGASTLNARNAGTIQGNVDIAAGSTFRISDSPVAAALFIGTAITGTGSVQLFGDTNTNPQATFRNVTAGGITLTDGQNGTVTFDTGPSVFNNVTVPFVSPTIGINAPVFTTSTGLTINNTLTLGGGATFNGDVSAQTLTWTGGTLAGTGIKTFTNVTSNNADAATSFNGPVVLNGGTWTNNGTITQNGAGTLTLSNGASVLNPTLSIWNLSSTDATPMLTGTGTGSFNNSGGTLNDQGTTGHTLAITSFINGGGGNVNVVGPGAGASLTLPGGSTDNGSYNVAANTELVFNGNRTLAAGTNIGGTGRVLFTGGIVNISGGYDLTGGTGTHVAGGTVNFNNTTAPVLGNTLLITSGVLGGSGPIAHAGTFDWQGGTVTGTGGFATSGATNITASVTLNGRSWSNDAPGVVRLDNGGQLKLGTGATVNNNASWILNSTSSEPIKNDTTLPGGSTVFANTLNGTLTKTAAAANGSIDTVFSNAGGVTISDGTLTLGPQQADLDSGSYALTLATSSLVFAGGRTLTGTSNITGNGHVIFDTGAVLLRGGYAIGGNAGSQTTIRNGAAAIFGDTPGPDVTLGNLTLTNTGSLSGSRNLLVPSNFTWSGGTIAGDAGTTLTTGGGSTTIISAPVTLTTRSFINNGRVEQSGLGQITFNSTPTITNNGATAPAGWYITSTSVTPFKGVGTFNNTGLLDLSGDVDRVMASTFTNTGQTLLHEGTLRLPTGTTDTGTYDVQTGGLSAGTLVFEGDRVLGAGSNISGTGNVIFDTGTVNLNRNYSFVGRTTVQNTGLAVFNTTAPVTFQSLLTVSGGELDGNQNMTAAAGLDWSGGVISGSGLTTFTTSGPATSVISGAVTLDGRTWNNAGPVNHHGAGRLTLANNAVVNNQAGAVWSVSSTDATPITGPGSFNNAGTFRTLGGMPHTIAADTTFRNQNLVQVLAGDLSFDDPGTHSGTFSVAGGNTLEFSGNQGFQNGSVITGAGGVDFSGGASGFQSGARAQNLGSFTVSGGNVNVQTGAIYNAVGTTNISNGNLTFAGAANTNTLNLSGGTLQGGSMTVNTGGTWSGGQLVTTGLTLAPGATLNLTGAALKRANGVTLANNGTMNVIGGGALLLENGSVVQNAGVFDIRSDAQIAVFPGGATSTFANTGTLQKSGGVDSTFQPSLTNAQSGTIRVSAGTLRATGAFPVNDGTIVTEPNTTFSTNGMSLTNSATGVLMGKGTLDLGTAMLTNNGMVAPGASPGTLVINGDYTQGPAGILAIELAGPVQGVSYDLLQVTGTANLGGTLQVVTSGGYAPSVGQAFDFLTYAAHTGDFATKTFPNASFQGVPGTTAYGVNVVNASSGNQGVRNVAIEETERLRENFIDLISARDADIETKPAGRQVCN